LRKRFGEVTPLVALPHAVRYRRAV
jgi:hypothetical protein